MFVADLPAWKRLTKFLAKLLRRKTTLTGLALAAGVGCHNTQKQPTDDQPDPALIQGVINPQKPAVAERPTGSGMDYRNSFGRLKPNNTEDPGSSGIQQTGYSQPSSVSRQPTTPTRSDNPIQTAVATATPPGKSEPAPAVPTGPLPAPDFTMPMATAPVVAQPVSPLPGGPVAPPVHPAPAKPLTPEAPGMNSNWTPPVNGAAWDTPKAPVAPIAPVSPVTPSSPVTPPVAPKPELNPITAPKPAPQSGVIPSAIDPGFTIPPLPSPQER